jgi:two-component system, chemotaxis family, sensor kinase CheA
MNEDDFQQRLLATFRLEAHEHISGISSGLIELEKTSEQEKHLPLIETIFRQAHNLKGAARSVNAAEIETVCRSLETALARLKRHEVRPTVELLDSLHQSVDTLRQLLAAMTDGTEPPRARANEVTEQVRQALAHQEHGTESPAPVVEPPKTAPAPPEIKPALPETVRIATAKLDKVLFQAEELLSARLSAAQRAADLEKLYDMVAQWRKEWMKVLPHVRPRRPQDYGAQPTGQIPEKLVEFFDWNEGFMQIVERDLAATARATDHDQRSLRAMVDTLLEDTKEALMLPFASLLEILPRMVRDLAREQHKEVNLVLNGVETEIDRRILEELKDAFIHLVRNSIDHGIELPQERRRKQKPSRGTLTISISQKSSSNVEIVVSDDGGGMDVNRIKETALHSGMRSAHELRALSPEQLLGLVFESGFSTAPILTEISGRGLGLAIVREKVEKLGGTVSLQTEPGEGTTFGLVVPLTLARFRGVLIGAAGQRFIVPTMSIRSVARVAFESIKTVENRETVQLDGETLSLARLAEVLEIGTSGKPSQGERKFPLLVLGSEERSIAFLVDEVLTEQEVLMKQLGRQLVRIRNVAGATVLGDGKVVPILNVTDLIKSALKSAGAPPMARQTEVQISPKARSILVVEDSITSRTLLKNILQGGGYKVDTAVDGIDALTALKTKRYDLVVSDVDMPRLNGLELTARIRKDAQLSHLPVVLVTALASQQDRERGIDVGANAYVVKSSFDQSNLLEVIQRLI